MGENMKIIVLSDSHGGGFYIKKVLDMHRDADAAFFLGDGISDFFALKDNYSTLAFIGVRGNCDIGYGDMYAARACEEITLEGKRVFACHGNAYSVKGGTGALVAAARARNADIVLFGHTHKRCSMYIPEGEGGERPLYLINPGSVGGRGDEGHSFCVLDIRDGQVLSSFGSV